MVEVAEFFSNGYVLSLLLFLVLVIMNTLLQAGNFLMIREGVRLRGALQVISNLLCLSAGFTETFSAREVPSLMCS